MSVGRSTWRLTGLSLLAFLLLVAALHLYLNSSHARAWILARVTQNLVRHLGVVEVGDRFSVDWIGRVTIGPLTLSDENGVTFSAASLTVRPAYRRLLAGRVEPASITLDKINIDLDRAQEAYKRLSENRGKSSEAPDKSQPPALLDIGVRANEIHLQTAQPELQRFLRALEPLSAKIGFHRSPADWTAKGELRFSKDGRSTIDLQRGTEGTVQLKMNLEAPHIDQVFHEVEALPLSIKEGTLLVQIDLKADQSFNHATTSCTARMRQLLLDGERLDSSSIGPIDLHVGANVSWDRMRREIRLTKTELGISSYAPLPL